MYTNRTLLPAEEYTRPGCHVRRPAARIEAHVKSPIVPHRTANREISGSSSGIQFHRKSPVIPPIPLNSTSRSFIPIQPSLSSVKSTFLTQVPDLTLFNPIY